MPNRKLLRPRRAWEDWLGIGLGLAIMLAPWVVSETSNQAAVVNAALAGLAVLMLAELDLVKIRRWAEIGQLACGLWVAASPFIFGYSGTGMLRVWHIVAGLLVVVIAALELRQQNETEK